MIMLAREGLKLGSQCLASGDYAPRFADEDSGLRISDVDSASVEHNRMQPKPFYVFLEMWPSGAPAWPLEADLATVLKDDGTY